MQPTALVTTCFISLLPGVASPKDDDSYSHHHIAALKAKTNRQFSSFFFAILDISRRSKLSNNFKNSLQGKMETMMCYLIWLYWYFHKLFVFKYISVLLVTVSFVSVFFSSSLLQKLDRISILLLKLSPPLTFLISAD